MIPSIYIHLFHLPKTMGLALRFVMPWRNRKANMRLQGDFQAGRSSALVAVRNVLIAQKVCGLGHPQQKTISFVPPQVTVMVIGLVRTLQWLDG